MRECAVSQLKSGMILGQALYTYQGDRRTLLLGRGVEISIPIVKRLEDIGYSFVYIEEEGTENILPQDILSEETRANALAEISQFLGDLLKLFEEMQRDSTTPVDFMTAINMSFNLPRTAGLKEIVRSIIEDLFIIGLVPKYEATAVIPKTNAIHRHSLNTTVLSLILGYHYDYTDPELQELGLGALMHDIGKLTLLKIFEKKYWEFTPEEKKEMRKHPELGEKILENSRTISEIVRQIIIQHHERQDGTGYPNGLFGDNSEPLRTNFTEPNHIFRFAEIVNVANTFDNYLSGFYTSHRLSPLEAMTEVKREAGTKLNYKIVELLSQSINYYPVGSNLKIIHHHDSDIIGYEGVVSKILDDKCDELEVVLLFDQNKKRIPVQKIVISSKKDEAVELLMAQQNKG